LHGFAFVVVATLRVLHGDFSNTASGLNLLTGVEVLLDGFTSRLAALTLQECGLSDEKSGA
jgi:hypothetical protein